MTQKRVYSMYVGHIREAGERAQRYVAGMSFEQFTANEQAIDATVRTLEIIGEATKRLPGHILALEPDIP